MNTNERIKEASILLEKGDVLPAKEIYRKILKGNPNHIDANYMLGTLYGEQGEYNTALKFLKHASRIDASSPYIQNNMGIVYQKSGDHAKAKACYKRALILKSDFAQANYNLATILKIEGQLDEALKCYENSLKSNPDFTSSQVGIASIHEMRGNYDDAMRIIKPLIPSSNHNAALLTTYSDICSHSKTSYWTRAKAIWILKKNIFDPNKFNKFNSLDKKKLCFSLAQLYDKMGKYKKAFKLYCAGNSHNRYQYNHEITEKSLTAVKNTYTSEFIEKMPRYLESQISPIFVVSMPRSGSSLVESILAAHSQVEALGETDYLSKLLSNTYNRPQSRGLKQTKLKNLNQEYSQHIQTDFLQKNRLTDKSIGNFWNIGEILQLFPEANIIHVQRDPIATSLSCFFHDFAGQFYYSNNLKDLGIYYKSYLNLMHHWEAVCGERILTVKYEDLVENPTVQVRRLLEFCDLPWEDACLEFYKNKRVIATSSYHQANKPIYKAAVNHHKHYLPYLSELVDILNTK